MVQIFQPVSLYLLWSALRPVARGRFKHRCQDHVICRPSIPPVSPYLTRQKNQSLHRISPSGSCPIIFKPCLQLLLPSFTQLQHQQPPCCSRNVSQAHFCLGALAVPFIWNTLFSSISKIDSQTSFRNVLCVTFCQQNLLGPVLFKIATPISRIPYLFFALFLHRGLVSPITWHVMHFNYILFYLFL